MVNIYLRRWTDNAGTYCGYMQAITAVSSDCGVGCGDEPVVGAWVQMYQQDGFYLGGYSWSGLGYAKTTPNYWWFAGPLTWVTCGSPVKAYGSWLEQYNVNGERDFGVTVPADGESNGLFTGSVAPC
jgi:hypothetical protein